MHQAMSQAIALIDYKTVEEKTLYVQQAIEQQVSQKRILKHHSVQQRHVDHQASPQRTLKPSSLQQVVNEQQEVIDVAMIKQPVAGHQAAYEPSEHRDILKEAVERTDIKESMYQETTQQYAIDHQATQVVGHQSAEQRRPLQPVTLLKPPDVDLVAVLSEGRTTQSGGYLTQPVTHITHSSAHLTQPSIYIPQPAIPNGPHIMQPRRQNTQPSAHEMQSRPPVTQPSTQLTQPATHTMQSEAYITQPIVSYSDAIYTTQDMLVEQQPHTAQTLLVSGNSQYNVIYMTENSNINICDVIQSLPLSATTVTSFSQGGSESCTEGGGVQLEDSAEKVQVVLEDMVVEDTHEMVYTTDTQHQDT